MQVMQNNMRSDSGRDVDVEPVAITSDYHAEIAVPLTSEQLVALEAFGEERGLNPARAAQELLARALAER